MKVVAEWNKDGIIRAELLKDSDGYMWYTQEGPSILDYQVYPLQSVSDWYKFREFFAKKLRSNYGQNLIKFLDQARREYFGGYRCDTERDG